MARVRIGVGLGKLWDLCRVRVGLGVEFRSLFTGPRAPRDSGSDEGNWLAQLLPEVREAAQVAGRVLEDAVGHIVTKPHAVVLPLVEVPELHVLVLGQAIRDTRADLLGEAAALLIASVDHQDVLHLADDGDLLCRGQHLSFLLLGGVELLDHIRLPLDVGGLVDGIGALADRGLVDRSLGGGRCSSSLCAHKEDSPFHLTSLLGAL